MFIKKSEYEKLKANYTKCKEDYLNCLFKQHEDSRYAAAIKFDNKTLRQANKLLKRENAVLRAILGLN